MPSNRSKVVKVILAVFAGLIVLAGSFVGYLYFKISGLKGILSDCEMVGAGFDVEIPFTYVNGIILVEARINGGGRDYEFIFDTGAPTVLSMGIIEELGLENLTPPMLRRGSTETAIELYFTRMDRLEIGGVEYRDVGAMAMDVGRLGTIGCLSRDGILGYNVIGASAVQIDYEKRIIRLVDDVSMLDGIRDAAGMTYSTGTQETPELRVTIDGGIEAVMKLDTGCNDRIKMIMPAAGALLGSQDGGRMAVRKTSPAGTIRGEGAPDSTIEELLYRARSVMIGGLSFRDIPLTVIEDEAGVLEGLIGNRFLEAFVVTLDYRNESVYFLPRREGLLSATAEVPGLHYGPSGGDVVVKVVYVGSEADELGIAVGDRLLSINGMDVTGLSDEDLCRIARKELAPDAGADPVRYVIERDGVPETVLLERFRPLPMLDERGASGH